MADKKQEALYQWLSSELQKVKNEILSEVRASGGDSAAKEIRYGYKQTQSVYEALSAQNKKLAEQLNELAELKYNYQQLQSAYESLAASVHTAPEVDYERLSDLVAEKVAEKLANACASCVCEAKEETPVEETASAADEPVEEELAVASAEVAAEEAAPLVNVEHELVDRYKRSFTAKLKQSEEKLKVYYSDIKNALISHKRINSNVSWQSDRFNCGRDTVAKITIVGKRLNFYLALDPNDPEFKTTVYHQKDVGAQRAYEDTPFMVKITSDAGAKKALRLVESLAQKLEAEKDVNYSAVDYVAEYAYADDAKLIEEGFIKVKKEKKVDLSFLA